MTSPAFLRTDPLRSRRLLGFALGLVSLGAAACGDAETARRVAADRTLTEAAAQYRRTMLTASADSGDATAGELSSLLARLDGAGGSAEQQSAASALASSIANSLANLELDRARQLESTARHARTIVGNTAFAAASLANLAEVQGSISLAGDRTFVQERRAAAEAELRAAQAAVRELEGPVAQLVASTGETRGLLTGLEVAAEDLRRQANSVDAILALPLVEQRAVLQGQSRTVRTSLALEELSLGSLRPELDFANASLVASQGVIAASNSALNELDNFASTLTGDADRSRAEADRLRKAAVETLARLKELQAGPLAETYERVQRAIEQAASNAGRAGGGMERIGERGRLAAEITRGAMYAQQAASAEQESILFAQLASAGTLFGGESGQRAAIEEASARRGAAIGEATAAFQAALEVFDRMNVEEPAVARGRFAVEGMIALLEGKPQPGAGGTPGAAPAFGGAPVPTTAAATTFGPGFPSVEALISAFEAAESDPAKGLETSRRGIAVSNRDLADVIRLGFSTAEDMLPLITAVTERFGPEAATALLSGGAGGSGGGFGATQFKTIERGGQRVLVTIAADGQSVELPLIQVGAAWYALADKAMGDLDPAAIAMLRQMSGMAESMRGPMKAAFAEVAAQVRSGSISSPDQLQAAMMAAMQKAMSGGGGGGGGF